MNHDQVAATLEAWLDQVFSQAEVEEDALRFLWALSACAIEGERKIRFRKRITDLLGLETGDAKRDREIGTWQNSAWGMRRSKPFAETLVALGLCAREDTMLGRMGIARINLEAA